MTKAYEIISSYYGDKTAQRSKIRYMNHIDEAIEILKGIGADQDTIDAFCIHPIVQPDDALVKNIPLLKSYDNNKVIILAMEYRRVANNYLSKREIKSLDEIELSPLVEVNMMLWADKVQNQRDFNIHHLDKHPRSAALEIYFQNWIRKLTDYFAL